MKILICGDRNWTNKKKIQDELIRAIENEPILDKTKSPASIVVIHGGARGRIN